MGVSDYWASPGVFPLNYSEEFSKKFFVETLAMRILLSS